MRKFYTLFILAMVFAATLNAEVLLVENFTDTVGKPLTSCGWITTYGSASQTAVSNGLEFEGYYGSGIGNGAICSGTDSSNQPHKSFKKQTSGSIYVAFMLQAYDVTAETYFFSLRDAISTTSFNFFGRVQLNTNYQIGLRYSKNDAQQYASQPLDPTETYLVVLKYEIVEGSSNDIVSLYLLDQITNEPATPLLSVTSTQDISPENIVLRSNKDDDWILVDGIRVATTWEEAVGKSTTAIGNHALNSLNFYASNGELHIDLPANDRIRLFDTTGKCIFDGDLLAGSHAFPLQKGFYVLRTSHETHKIIVR